MNRAGKKRRKREALDSKQDKRARIGIADSKTDEPNDTIALGGSAIFQVRVTTKAVNITTCKAARENKMTLKLRGESPSPMRIGNCKLSGRGSRIVNR